MPASQAPDPSEWLGCADQEAMDALHELEGRAVPAIPEADSQFLGSWGSLPIVLLPAMPVPAHTVPVAASQNVQVPGPPVSEDLGPTQMWSFQSRCSGESLR